jgi:secondary thiamine-phosphate synthase enzyme
MKAFTEYLTFHTQNRRELVNITGKLEDFLKRSGIQEGFLLVSAMHITVGIFINDNEPGFHADLMEMLERLAPSNVNYKHHLTGEDNGDAHLKNILVGHQVIVPITKGKLDFGPWQEVYYAEFDGQRPKRVLLKAIGE